MIKKKHESFKEILTWLHEVFLQRGNVEKRDIEKIGFIKTLISNVD